MTRAFAATILLVAVTLLGISMSIWDIDDKIASDFPMLAPFVEPIEFVFLGLSLLCSLALFYYTYLTLRDFVEALKEGDAHLFNRGLQYFVCFDLKADDLEDIERIYSDTTPATTSIETSLKLYSRCRKGWKKIIDSRTGGTVGYFIVLPLSRVGLSAIHSREFSFDSPRVDQCFNRRLAAGCSAYIGMIGAEVGNKKARQATLVQLRRFVNSGRYSKIYAKAATKDGLRLLNRKKFKPVFKEDGKELGVMFVKSNQMAQRV